MARVYYLPDNRELVTQDVITILQASEKAGIPHTHACGGHARCSTCRVMVVEGLENCDPRNAAEQKMADKLHFPPQIRLACQTTFCHQIKVRRLVIDDEDLELTDQTAFTKKSGTVGEEKTIVIFFSDIRGFTNFSETVPAYDVIHVLNRYFHLMGAIIERNGGYIDNYMGDGIMALFGVDNPAGAVEKALQAGLEMLQEMVAFNEYLRALYDQGLEIGIGIHYGEAVVGTVGAINNKKLTAIGDAVNFASRIESANKEAKTHLLISEDTYAEVKDRFRFGKTVRLSLKGKTGEYNLYEVLGTL
jgi:adenylate cyclase